MAAVGASGVTSADRDNAEAIPWEFEGGHTGTLSPEAFDAHPETPDASEIDDVTLTALCRCCTASDNCIDCGSGSPYTPEP